MLLRLVVALLVLLELISMCLLTIGLCLTYLLIQIDARFFSYNVKISEFFQTNPALSGNHLMDGTSGYCKFANRSTSCLVTPPRIF